MFAESIGNIGQIPLSEVSSLPITKEKCMHENDDTMQACRLNLAEFLIQATPSYTLRTVINDLAESTMQIASLVAKGAITNATQKLSQQNIQGETQLQLDVASNQILIASLQKSKQVRCLISEELEDPYLMEAQGAWLVCCDPLDGSSNVAINGVVGTIFSVLPAQGAAVDLLQAGVAQVASGYALYGPATMLVMTLGDGTHGFTLDPHLQTYVLTHPNMRIPAQASEYAINMSNERFWEPPIKRYIAACNAGSTGLRGRDFNMRWVASMVADVHRVLMRGGVYLYPVDSKVPRKTGRLRLLYEANPMSFLIEQAGGKSTDGRQRLMALQPTHIHQRVPVVMGSADEVDLITHYHQDFDT